MELWCHFICLLTNFKFFNKPAKKREIKGLLRITQLSLMRVNYLKPNNSPNHQTKLKSTKAYKKNRRKRAKATNKYF